MEKWVKLKKLKLCCVAVLPTIFTEELSYYETICKLNHLLGGIISNFDIIKEQVDINTDAIKQLQQAVDDIYSGDYKFLREIIEKAIKNVYFGLTDSGYFVAYIPKSWEDITFKTTEYDYHNDLQPHYGHLVLLY